MGLWEGYGATKAANGAGGAATSTTTKGQSFDATVVRIWGPDQLSIVAKGDSPTKDRRVQLASVRGPRGADAKNSYYAAEGKEFLRKRLVGKVVNVHIDYVKPKDGEYDERECVTIKYGGNQNNVAEQLIEKGLATVLRHRRDDEDRSMEYDKLVLAEQSAAGETKGLHSPKEVSLARIVDASENNSRAAQYLPSWKRHGKHNAVVDFVSAGSRFKLLLPKENAKITFVLAGIRAPRTARNPNEKSEPYGNEAHRFASRALQRDVEVTFDSTDKQGGFIGGMFIGNNNVAVDLVRSGLATVHEPSARNLPFGNELLAAEEEAKNERKNVSARRFLPLSTPHPGGHPPSSDASSGPTLTARRRWRRRPTPARPSRPSTSTCACRACARTTPSPSRTRSWTRPTWRPSSASCLTLACTTEARPTRRPGAGRPRWASSSRQSSPRTTRGTARV